MTAGVITFEGDDGNGSTWFAIQCYRYDQSAAPEGSFALSVTTRMWSCPVAGMARLSVRLSTVITGSGTATVAIVPTASPFTLSSPSFGITGVTLNSGRIPVLADLNNGSATATVGGVSNVALVWSQYPTLQKGGTSAMTGTTSTQVIAAVSSNYLYIGSCSVNNTHASVDTLVDLQDGSGGTVIWTFGAAHGYGGETHVFNPPLKVPTVGNALYAANETTGASVKVFCQGFSSTTSY